MFVTLPIFGNSLALSQVSGSYFISLYDPAKSLTRPDESEVSMTLPLGLFQAQNFIYEPGRCSALTPTCLR